MLKGLKRFWFKVSRIESLLEEIRDSLIDARFTPFIDKYRPYLGEEIVILNTTKALHIDETVGKLISVGTTYDKLGGNKTEKRDYLLLQKKTGETKIVQFYPGIVLHRIQSSD